MSKGDQTKAEILAQAFRLASIHGLEGLSIGMLAREVGMSKSGLFAHFKSKENLQCAVIEWTAESFTSSVIVPAIQKGRGVARLYALFEYWIDWHESNVSPGGCVMIAACSEFDDKPGAVQELLLQYEKELASSLAQMAKGAQELGEFDPELDPDQFAFELYGAILGFHHYHRMLHDSQARQKLMKAVQRLIERSRL